jgi:TPP-dependent pyruvate/acetoin dehydrogenase alpha subunit
MDIPRETLVLMYERMLKIRHFENRVKDLFAAGEMPGFVLSARARRSATMTISPARTAGTDTSSPRAAT